MFSIGTSSFTNYFYSDASVVIKGITTDGSRIYLGGIYTDAYYATTLNSIITANSMISDSPITMDSYTTGQTESVVTSSTSTPSDITLTTTTSTSITLDTTTALSNSVTPTDVQYYVSSVSYTGLSSTTYYSKSISLTCSTGGSTPITYSLVSYNGQTLPSWVTLDSSSQLLNFTTPTVSTVTTYQFAVEATISGSNYQTPVTLSVNAATSSSTGSTNGSSATTQTSTVSYTSEISSSTTSTIASTSVSVISASTVSTSMISGSSPQSLWATINQFQFFMMLPMIGAFVPDAIINFLQGVDFCLFNFNFISLPKSGVSGDFLSFFS